MMHASSSSSSDETLADPILISETERLLQELQDTNRTLLNVIQRLEDNQPLSKSIHLAMKKLLHHYAKWLLALPNLVATFVWLSMLLYFTGWYLSLPRDEKGRHPQICESFSLWPYISCIGEKKPSVFRGVCITMAVLISISFLLFCHLSSQIAPGLWLRRTAALFAVISSCALITLSFKSIDSAPKVHLVATTIQIFSMGNTKFFDWLSNAVVRKSFRNRIGAFRRVRPLEVARWLKSCVAAFAAVPAMVTCMGVYSCMDIKEINDPTSTCNKVVALSAVAEWILSIGWVAYMATIAYDLYHIGIVVEVWQLAGNSLATKGCESSDWEDQRTEQSLQFLIPHPPHFARKQEGHETVP